MRSDQSVSWRAATMKRIIFILLFPCSMVFAQSTNAPLDRDYNHLIERMEIMSGTFTPGFHTVYKAYPRKAIAEFMDSLQHSNLNLSTQDKFNISYLENDNWEWAEDPDNTSSKVFLKNFYKVKSDLWQFKNKDFDFHINPILYVGAGYESESDITPLMNTRGKVGFYSFLTDNQITMPYYVRDFIKNRGAVPHEGFFKKFKENGVDFFTARGYISFQISKHINAQFGHDRFFIGNGYRSMILSDFSAPYLFLKFNTRVGRFKYTNLFTQMKADARGKLGGSPSGKDYPVKYVVLHHLSINVAKNFNFGLFESIAYGREDSTGSNHFDINYLNPIIFYRAIEQQNGSQDNVMIGGDFRWNIAGKFSLYGQFVLDEFKLNEIKAGDGWWANKYAFQLGGKYINVFNVSNLDLLLEYNYARPYIYSHTSVYGNSHIYTNFGNYLQEISHPLGANFNEVIAEVRYQPFSKFTFTLRGIFADKGEDDTDTNWGGNIFKDNQTKEQVYGNVTGQGVSTSLALIDFTTTFHLKHNAFFDAKFIYRKKDSDDDARDQQTNFINFAFRWNINQRLHDF